MTLQWNDGVAKTGDDVRETKKRREILNKQYVADAAYTVVLEVAEPSEDELLEVLIHPNWPLYIGRKSCGAGPLRPRTVDTDTIQEALQTVELHRAAQMKDSYRIWVEGGESRSIYGLRDWESRIHAGQQWIEEDTIGTT